MKTMCLFFVSGSHFTSFPEFLRNVYMPSDTSFKAKINKTLR